MLRRKIVWQRNEDKKIPSGQIGRGHEKQEGRESWDQEYEDAKQKPNDEVAMEIHHRREYVVEGGHLCKVGNGLKVAFWEEKWIAQRTLKQLFPDLHLLSFQQQATAAKMWTCQGWNLQLRRNLNDWEVERIGTLYNTLAPFNNLTGEEDTTIWKVGNKGAFTVNSEYRNITYNVNCFTWLLTREVVLTPDNMKKRKYHLCSRCYLCEEQTKTVNHLFLHCKRANSYGDYSSACGKSLG
ncbi:hypothetical protein MTR67_012546 [Solanum verrucosum]|uniref:Reverse transcriptase zinc-binding domain-containing protein n=1 Tax=Solanum verrucosum TaxID=315347 RepID=A0AAF0TH41_SOLVR|nr:hypothetical protein MTR67_012546 [Solanum verrucosum]